MSETLHVLSADCPCGPEVVRVPPRRDPFPIRVVTCIYCDNDAHTTREHDDRDALRPTQGGSEMSRTLEMMRQAAKAAAETLDLCGAWLGTDDDGTGWVCVLAPHDDGEHRGVDCLRTPEGEGRDRNGVCLDCGAGVGHYRWCELARPAIPATEDGRMREENVR